MALHCWHDAKI